MGIKNAFLPSNFRFLEHTESGNALAPPLKSLSPTLHDTAAPVVIELGLEVRELRIVFHQQAEHGLGVVGREALSRSVTCIQDEAGDLVPSGLRPPMGQDGSQMRVGLEKRRNSGVWCGCLAAHGQPRFILRRVLVLSPAASAV